MNVLARSRGTVRAHRSISTPRLWRDVETNMRNATLAAVAVLAVLALAVGGVAAHGSDETDASHGDVSENESADAWAAWMEQQMVEHMGEERAKQMVQRMPMTDEEMGQHMAPHDNGGGDGTMGGTSGMGCH